jgi:uncharacterized protein (DUF488 family)
MTRTIYTVGHSSHTVERFVALLGSSGIEVLVDTRSAPYSRYSPQFDREALRDAVGAAGCAISTSATWWVGDRRTRRTMPIAGARYAAMGRSAEFLAGIARLERGADEFRVALLCSEEDPAHCHRRLLVGRVLMERGAELLHLRSDGQVQTEAAVAAASGKALVEAQPALFAEMEEDKWRSTASVSRKGPLIAAVIQPGP